MHAAGRLYPQEKRRDHHAPGTPAHLHRLVRDTQLHQDRPEKLRVPGLGDTAGQQPGGGIRCEAFDRSTLPIQATAAGKQLYHDAKILLRQYIQLKEGLPRLEQEGASQIRLCYTSQIDLQILLPFVRQFKAAHPAVAFQVELCPFRDASQMLWAGKCDGAIGIDFEPEFTQGMETLVLYEGEYQALVPQGHPLFQREVLSREELYQYPLVMLSPEVLGRSYDGMIRHAQLDGYYPHIQQTANDLASELFVMLTENLIGFVPDNYFPEEYRGQLRRIPIENGHHQFRLELKYLPGENPAVPLFVKELSNYLKNQ